MVKTDGGTEVHPAVAILGIFTPWIIGIIAIIRFFWLLLTGGGS